MKIYLCVLLISVLSCDRQNDRVKRKYILENGMDKGLKIDFWLDGSYEDSAYIKGIGVVAEGIADDLGLSKPLNPTFYGGSDSIIVTYDNAKRQIYYWNDGFKAIPPTSRNILSNDVYTIENNELYRFTFTEEDYENAELID